MTKRQRILVFGFAGLMAVAGIAVFAYIIHLTIKGASNPASPVEDRKLVVTAGALEQFGAAAVDPAHESLSSVKAFDGSRTIEYSYSSGEGSPDGSRLYVSSTAQVFPQALSTMQMFRVQQLAMKGGLSLAGDTSTVPAPSLLNVGDDHYAAVLKTKKTGEPIGNLLMVRQGRAMLTVIVIGMTFDDAEAVLKLLGPPLEESRRRFVKR
jgi:hypothetical protein